MLLGRFNPLIFSPEWLAKHGVIGPVEAEAARIEGIEVMAPNVTSIKLGSMKLLVEAERFMLVVADHPLIRAKDFAVTCFNVLRHTPVHAIGLNYNATLVGSDENKWHRLGDQLAPKEPWGDFLTGAKGKRLGGLRSIALDQIGCEVDERWTHTRLQFEVQEGPGMQALLNINNHFKLGSDDKPQTGLEAYRLIDELWEPAMKKSSELTNNILELANAA